MVIKRKQADISVVEAARRRIKNVFDNGLPVYMSFSGGKDTLCMAHITLELIKRGRIDPAQLTCIFIDEEAIFPCSERVVKEWRLKFMEVGARFDWYCIEVKHYSCLNELEGDESFICWDRNKKKVWVRQPPPFAIRSHPDLKARVDTYQEFLDGVIADGVGITGVRVAESVQRLQNFSLSMASGKAITNRNAIYPVYDWADDDVWLYLLEHNVDIPEAYLYMWQVGRSRREMRISQFFSIDCVGFLVHLDKFYPGLMDRVIKREPAAYMAALYWDSELFRRSTKRRRKLEGGKKVDYKDKVLKLLSNIDTSFNSEAKRWIAGQYRNLVIKRHMFMTDNHWRRVYGGLIAGDPKRRTLRSVATSICYSYGNKAMRRRKRGEI